MAKVQEVAPEMPWEDVLSFFLYLLVASIGFTMFLFAVLYCFMVSWGIMLLAVAFNAFVTVGFGVAALNLWDEGKWRAHGLGR